MERTTRVDPVGLEDEGGADNIGDAGSPPPPEDAGAKEERTDVAPAATVGITQPASDLNPGGVQVHLTEGRTGGGYSQKGWTTQGSTDSHSLTLTGAPALGEKHHIEFQWSIGRTNVHLQDPTLQNPSKPGVPDTTALTMSARYWMNLDRVVLGVLATGTVSAPSLGGPAADLGSNYSGALLSDFKIGSNKELPSATITTNTVGMGGTNQTFGIVVPQSSPPSFVGGSYAASITGYPSYISGMKAPQSSIYGEQFGSLGHANQGGVSQSNIGVGVGGSLSFSVGKYDLLTFSVGFTFTETNTNVNGLRESYESVGGLFTTSFTAGRFFGGSP